MFLDVSPPLSDANAKLLENELGQIAGALKIKGVEIAPCVEEGIELVASFMIYYEDGDKDDDEELAQSAERILKEFLRLQSEGKAQTRDWDRVRAKIGKLKITLDRDDA